MFRDSRRLIASLLLVLTSNGVVAVSLGEAAVLAPAAKFDAPKKPGELETAVLAGGCFWGVEGVFEHLRGVKTVKSGYAGGDKSSAQYEMVSRGSTGHAEAVQIVFDPNERSYGEILRIFFSVVHDPTQPNRQGPDSGTQYRSAIFYADDMQRDIATRYVAQLGEARIYSRPIVTRVDPLRGFFAAEAYHQDFIAKNPKYPYVVINDLPKIRNLQQAFPDVYRADDVNLQRASPR